MDDRERAEYEALRATIRGRYLQVLYEPEGPSDIQLIG